MITCCSCIIDDMAPPDDISNGSSKDSIFNLSIIEPSDLTFTVGKNTFLTVSDNTGKVYEISRSGDLISTLDFTGIDLEGICVDTLTGDVYVAQERLSQIVHLSPTGVIKETLTLTGYITADANSNFEGVSKNGDTLYIVKEKNPGLLIKYNLATKNWTSTTLTFALDYSAITYDAVDKTLWIMSDESHTLFHCNLNGKALTKQSISVLQPEGIVIDHKANCAWVVGDSDKKLFKIILKQLTL